MSAPSRFDIHAASRLCCAFCKRKRHEVSMLMVGNKGICGLCTDLFARESGRDFHRGHAAFWAFAFQYFQQDADGTWEPACNPEQLAIAASAVDGFMRLLCAGPTPLALGPVQ